MEFWTIDSDGKGNFIIYPTITLGIGAIIAGVLAIIKVFVDKSTQSIYTFAQNYTWIVLLVIAIISVIIGIISCFAFKANKASIPLSMSFSLSLALALSLCYAEIIYWVGGFGDSLKKVFIIAIMMAGVFFLFLFVHLAVTFLILAGAFFAYLQPSIAIEEEKEKSHIKIAYILSYVINIGVNVLLFFLFFSSQLPTYLMSSIN